MNIELCFAYQSGLGQAALDLALEWRELLGCKLTVFTDTDCSAELDGPLPPGATLTNLQLSDRVNRYDRHTTGLTSWSPWGTKSGPNFQFFRILEHYQGSTDNTWLLYLEPDTYCSVVEPKSHLESLLTRHESAWVIGAEPHAISRPYIDKSLHDHINGACLMRVGSTAFHSFLSQVWVPSVLWKIRARPYYAYDCITATLEWNALPNRLREEWQRAAQHFVRTPTMWNLSNRELNQESLRKLLLKEKSKGLDSKEIWFVHAKISEYKSSSHAINQKFLREQMRSW